MDCSIVICTRLFRSEPTPPPPPSKWGLRGGSNVVVWRDLCASPAAASDPV